MGPPNRDHHGLPLAPGEDPRAQDYTAPMLRRETLAGLATCVLALAASASTPSQASATAEGRPAAITAALRQALAAPEVDPGRTGAIAVDLRTSRLIFQHNPDLALAPASAEKLPVAFAALQQLGLGFRFHTKVLGEGVLIGDEWRGDLYLVGSGDPTLALPDIGRLARDLRAAGIRRVAGSVVGDEGHFDTQRTARGWKPSFLGVESPPLSALVVDGVAIRGANSSAAAAAAALSTALERRGVLVSGAPRTGRAPTDTRQLAADHSARLKTIVLHMNRESDNFVAEMVLKELGAGVSKRGSTASGARVVQEALAQSSVPVEGVRIVDGSGLSGHDRLTARALVILLRTVGRDPELGDDFVASLPVAGISGTLRNRLAQRPTLGRVAAKTGTTSRACALAGFVGRRYAFAILQNGSPLSYWSARAAQDRFVTVLARS